ncbi:MAG: hypothetical protein H7315_04170 [Herminiimonas sp.]|nr:hypothetical protein [Herminiimonas sp.]
MEIFTLLVLVAVGAYVVKSKDQKKRIALLASHLGKYQIDKLMETLTVGYARALRETSPERQTQIWNLLNNSESALREQFGRFAADFARVDEADTKISLLPVAIPFADKLFPGATFDLRKALAIHANGIRLTADIVAPHTFKDKAYTLSAEMMLMRHTCHWFCRSKIVASARMLSQHQTSYEQLLAAVSPETRKAYQALIAA